MESAEDTPVASLVIIHGLGQYSELYYDFAKYFASYNYICHLIDLRGFGYSGGAKGQSDFEDMIKDIELVLQQVRKDLPLFVCGHSLGASLLLTIGERSPTLRISGFIALAPLLDPERHGYNRKNGILSKVTSLGIRLLGEFVGEILQSNWTLEQSLRRNKNLMVQSIGLQMVKSVMKGIRELRENASKFKFPVFVVQGTADCVCKIEHTELFFDLISSEDRGLQIIPNMSHELVQDDAQGRVKLEVLAWMQMRLAAALPFSEITIKLAINKQASPKWRLVKMLVTMVFAKTITNISVGTWVSKFIKVTRILKALFAV